MRNRRNDLLSARPQLPEALRPSARRLRGLRAAWEAVAAACVDGGAREFAESEHATRRHFSTLATGPGEPGEARVRELGVLLDELARTLCDAVAAVPIERLRLALPRSLPAHRDRLLSLLDLLASDAFHREDVLPGRLAAVDYLVTLLCTGEDAARCATPSDPVILTPVVRELCSRAEAEAGASVVKLENEFFDAANLAVDVAAPDPSIELRARKAKLGRGYFAPRLLRAIVTYNAALEQARLPWTCEAVSEESEVPPAPAPPARDSVFASQPLGRLHEAVVARLTGKPMQRDPAHRIAWALGIDALTPSERRMLGEGVLEATDLRCAVVLVGLLGRSLNVLCVELQELGIDPDAVAGPWPDELGQLVKIEVGDAIMATTDGADYEAAQALSDLRNRFLAASPQQPEGRKPRVGGGGQPARDGLEERRVRREARALVGEAVAGRDRSAAPRPKWASLAGDLSWQRLAPFAAAVGLALVLGLHGLGVIDLLGRGLERWSGDELAAVSEYLVSGQRNGDGAGAGFVGTLDDRWLTLSQVERQRAAEELVAGLRLHGVSQVMIYDAERTLLIQGLGDSIRTL